MKNINLKQAVLVLAALGLALPLRAADTSSGNFLTLGAGSRALGMGEAFTAVADDATAVYWNPGGLGTIKGATLSLMHGVWVEGAMNEWASYAMPTRFGTFGLGGQYVSYGSLTQTDDVGSTIGSLHPSDGVAMLSYGIGGLWGLYPGVTVKYVSSKINKSASTVAGDVGLKWRTPSGDLTAGFVAQNLGGSLKYVTEKDSLPMTVKAGASYAMMQKSCLFSADVIKRNDSDIAAAAGVEYTYPFNKTTKVVTRTGYNTRNADTGGVMGFTLGLGLGLGQNMIDYAFAPSGVLGQTHKISFTLGF